MALILLVTGRVNDAARILIVLVLIGLLAAGIEILRAQTLREFPDADAAALLGEARERVSGWLEARRAAAAPAAPAPPTGDVATRLAQLADLHARG